MSGAATGESRRSAVEREVGRAVGAAQIALGFLVASFGPYLAVLSEEIDRPRAQLVWVSSTFGVGLVIAAVAGPSVLRLGAGRVLRAACLGGAIGAVAMATTPFVPVAGAGSALVGLCCAAIVLITPALLHGPGAARRLTRAVAAASTAGISAPLIFGLLEYAGVPGRLALFAPAPVLLLVALRPSVGGAAAPPAAASRPPLGAASIGWLRIVLAVACEFCFVVWAVARLADSGASLGTASILAASFTVGMAIGRLVGPRYAERGGAVAASTFAAAAGTLVVYFGDGPAVVTAGILLASLGISLLYPITLAQLVAVPGLEPRHSSSIGSLASGAAILSAPTVLGWLDGAIGLRTAFLLPIPLLAILLLLTRPKRRD